MWGVSTPLRLKGGNIKMAEEKKTKAPAKKAPVKKAPVKKVEAEDVATQEVVKNVAPAKENVAEKRKLTNDDEIEVMNNTTGRYGYKGRSGFSIEMSDYGDTVEIPFAELKRMRSEQKRHIEDAFIVILDEDAIKELRYEKLYESVFNTEGVDELLRNPEKLANVLPKMPSVMRETLGTVAKRKLENYEITNTRIKQVIEENLKITIDV